MVAPRSMPHFAVAVPREDALLAMRDRIRSHGVKVIGSRNQGFCQSIYFDGPDHLRLKAPVSMSRIDRDAWADVATLEVTGIAAEQAARYCAPAPLEGPSAVAQLPHEPGKSHQTAPPGRHPPVCR